MGTNTKQSTRKGDIRRIREQIVKLDVFLPSHERDEHGAIIMEEDGYGDMRPKREEEPFTSIGFKVNYMTPKVEDSIKALNNAEEWQDRQLNQAANLVPMLVNDWDLNDGGKAIPLTYVGIRDADVPGGVLYAILTACYEYNRPPKELSGTSQPSSSPEE